MPDVWIGVPVTEGNSRESCSLSDNRECDEYKSEKFDPTISRLGGVATYFRANYLLSSKEVWEYFKCPRCKSVNHVSLLAQLYAPIECYDRVIYILMCSECTKKHSQTDKLSTLSTTSEKLELLSRITEHTKHTELNMKSKQKNKQSFQSGNAKMNNRQREVARVLQESKSLKSYVFIVRSQNFNEVFYWEEIRAKENSNKSICHKLEAKELCKEENLMFVEADDWDDNTEDEVCDMLKSPSSSSSCCECCESCENDDRTNVNSKHTNVTCEDNETCNNRKCSNYETSSKEDKLSKAEKLIEDDDVLLSNVDINKTDSSEINIASCQTHRLVNLKEFEVYHNNVAVPLKGYKYTDGILLDIFSLEEENINDKFENNNNKSQKEIEEEMEHVNAVIDSTSCEVDEESAAEKCAGEYVRVIEQIPSQCIRWCPKSTPLRSSITTLPSIPRCGLCGAPREFELQLTAPTVYYLTKHLSEKDNRYLHFSNIFVYTCSANCISEQHPYCTEFAIVEEEL